MLAGADRVSSLEAENATLRAQLAISSRGGGSDVVLLDDERALQAAGVYRYHHPLENAVAYVERLRALEVQLANAIRAGTAIVASDSFTLDGSLAKGAAMTRDLSKLMLRAYNAEAESVVRTLRPGNVAAAIKRLSVARSSIASLGRLMDMHVSEAYHALRIDEIELTADFLMKREMEREEARAQRERLREERKVALELAATREKLEKERSHLLTVLQRVKDAGADEPALEAKLAEIDSAILQNDFRQANIRAGYVYVISNRGAFGAHIVKIGLTRRLEPLDRINELGDASVPFRFDVHAIYFSEDAVALEAQLHKHFASRRMNWANHRREFFFATPQEVRTVLLERIGVLLEFVELPESAEYLQSIPSWPDELRVSGACASAEAQ